MYMNIFAVQFSQESCFYKLRGNGTSHYFFTLFRLELKSPKSSLQGIEVIEADFQSYR